MKMTYKAYKIYKVDLIIKNKNVFMLDAAKY